MFELLGIYFNNVHDSKTFVNKTEVIKKVDSFIDSKKNILNQGGCIDLVLDNKDERCIAYSYLKLCEYEILYNYTTKDMKKYLIRFKMYGEDYSDSN